MTSYRIDASDSVDFPQTKPVLPLISIIVPVFNVEAYLGACLNSLAAQNDPAFEVVIVDDGSTDGSPDIIAAYCRAHAAFRSFRQENSGLGAARNKGFDNSQGEFVTFVDSDDWLATDSLAVWRQRLTGSGPDVISAGFRFVSDDGKTEFPAKSLHQHRLPQNGVTLSDAEQVLGLFAYSIACARLYRRSLLQEKKLRFPDRLPHEDWFFTYKALMLGTTLDRIETPLYSYRQRPDTLSKSITEAHVDSLQALWNDTEAFLAQISAPSRYRNLAARRTLLALYGMHKRALAGGRTVLPKLNQLVSERRPELISMLKTISQSELKDCWLPADIAKIITPDAQSH